MKKTKKNKPEDTDVGAKDDEISREAAIKKLGLLTVSAATMMLLLNEPAKGQDNPDSPDNPPDWP